MAKPEKVVNRNAINGNTSKYAKLNGQTEKGTITWSQTSGQARAELIDAVTATGDAITFGRTSDSGALSITILSGTDRHKLYFKTADDFHQQVPDIIEAALMPMG